MKGWTGCPEHLKTSISVLPHIKHCELFSQLLFYFFPYYSSVCHICLLCSISSRPHAAHLEEKGCSTQCCLPHMLLTTRKPAPQEAFLRTLRHCSRCTQSTHQGSNGWPCLVLTLILPSPSRPLCNIHTGGPVISIILLETLTNGSTLCDRMCLLLSPHSHSPLCPCQA